jgi:hypothetical protein
MASEVRSEFDLRSCAAFASVGSLERFVQTTQSQSKNRGAKSLSLADAMTEEARGEIQAADQLLLRLSNALQSRNRFRDPSTIPTTEELIQHSRRMSAIPL